MKEKTMTKDELIQKLTADEALVEKASACKDAASLTALAKENGLNLTEEEAQSALGILNPGKDEVCDDDLDKVAGGGEVKANKC